MVRFPSQEVIIGNCPLGGSNPIRVQSMTNTSSLDIEATVNQTKRIFDAGADYVRISAPSQQCAFNLEKIKKELTKSGYQKPLVADIHFNASLSLIAARLVEKVRINPGNYTGAANNNKTAWTASEEQQELETIRENLRPLVIVCKEYGTAIRVGTNFGSLSPRIVMQYGNTAEGMVQSTIEFLKILEDLGFDQTVISLKASSPLITVKSNWLMVKRMLELGMKYPLHLGVTEAGEGEDGRIVSTLGIGTLLSAGIGDTVRVSLSEAPEAEIPVATELVRPFNDFYARKREFKNKFNLEEFELQTENLAPLPSNHKSLVVGMDEKLDCNEPIVAVTLFGGLNSAKPDFFLQNLEKLNSPEYNLVCTERDIFENKVDSETNNSFFLLELPVQKLILEKLKGVKSPIIILKNQPTAQLIEDLRLGLNAQKISASLIPSINPGELSEDQFLNLAATSYGALLLQRKISGLAIGMQKWEKPEQHIKTAFGLLQAAGTRITKTQFISCPTCARTSFDLVGVVRQVKDLAKDKPGLKIAIMGCIVNGPGEMADADFGILGAGTNKVTIYKGKEPVIKNIEQNQAAELLLRLIG